MSDAATPGAVPAEALRGRRGAAGAHLGVGRSSAWPMRLSSSSARPSSAV